MSLRSSIMGPSSDIARLKQRAEAGQVRSGTWSRMLQCGGPGGAKRVADEQKGRDEQVTALISLAIYPAR